VKKRREEVLVTQMDKRALPRRDQPMICPDTLIRTRTGTAYIGRRIPEEGITRRVEIFRQETSCRRPFS